eukprot:11051925-Alexandrium_andersonii.AAC.2
MVRWLDQACTSTSLSMHVDITSMCWTLLLSVIARRITVNLKKSSYWIYGFEGAVDMQRNVTFKANDGPCKAWEVVMERIKDCSPDDSMYVCLVCIAVGHMFTSIGACANLRECSNGIGCVGGYEHFNHCRMAQDVVG